MDQSFLTKSTSKQQQQHQHQSVSSCSNSKLQQQQHQQQNTSDQLKNLTQSAENLFLVRQKDLTNLAEREKFLQVLHTKQQQVSDQTRQVNSLLAEISSLNDKCRDQVKVAEDEIQQCDSKISACEFLHGHQQNVALHLGTEKLFAFLSDQKNNQNQFFTDHNRRKNNENGNGDNNKAMFLFEHLLQILQQGKLSCEQDLLQIKNQNNNNNNNNNEQNSNDLSSIEFYNKRQTEELKKMTREMQNHQMKMLQNEEKNDNFSFSAHESSLKLFLQQQLQIVEIINNANDQSSKNLSSAFQNLLPSFLFEIFIQQQQQQQKQNENSENILLENIVEGFTSSQILELISLNKNQQLNFSSSSSFSNNAKTDELFQLESTLACLSQEINNLDSVLLHEQSHQLDLKQEENNRLKEALREKSDLVQILQQQHQEAENESVLQGNKRSEFSLFIQNETDQIQNILSKHNASKRSILLLDEKENEKEENVNDSPKNGGYSDETSILISVKMPQLHQLFQKLLQLHDQNQKTEQEIIHLEQTLVLQQENSEEKTKKLNSLIQRRDYLVGLVQNVSREILTIDFFENKIDPIVFTHLDVLTESNEDDAVGVVNDDCNNDGDDEKNLLLLHHHRSHGDDGMLELFESTSSNNTSPINAEDCALQTGTSNSNNNNFDEKQNKQLLQQIVKKNVKKSLLSAKKSWERVSHELSPLVSEKQKQLDDLSRHVETCLFIQ